MKRGLSWLALPLCALMLTGCVQWDTPSAQSQIFAMDTIMALEVYGKDGQDQLNQAVKTIYELEALWDVTQPGSELWAINHSHGAWTAVSPHTLELVEQSVALGELTQGALDFTAYPGVVAWGFSTQEYQVPSSQTLENLIPLIDYTKVEVERDTSQVRLPDGMAMDFGGVAKGYTGQLLAQQLREAGVTSALLYLGGNVQTVGAKPDGSPWVIGIQDPASPQQAPLGHISVVDRAVVTSGSYQRYFEENGVRYWHILDPDTAAPARSGLASVTIVGADGTLCDGLSTALFVMGQEKGAEFWRSHPELDIEVIWVKESGQVSITQGLEESFVFLGEGTVEVIAP